jgi:glycosyl hydrolase family 44/Big-like domain-containing protein
MNRCTTHRACYHLAAMLLFSLTMACPRLRAQTTPTLTVDATGSPHSINPDIYGIANYGLDVNFAKEIQVPNIRWGGDGTTRYNWQVDSSNAGFDWYFMGGNGQATVTPGASADLMINTYKTASNAHTLLTIPIIPYVNKSAAWNCSFPVSVYGAQQSTNPYVHPNGDNCGNSIASNGTQLLDNNIFANHIDNTVALQQGWVQHLITTFGTAANGGVPYYQLDNEPGGWSNTHRDVEPTQPDYDTIIGLGQQYAAMIKQTDPSAKVFGPVDFTLGGWIGTPSKQNNLFAGQYYLQQMATYDQANHQRILDYFDEHYYGGGSTDALELADTRSLWDPTYDSGTWVEQFYFDGPMNLIPRFQNWIQTYYPGTKLSISEYSFAMGTNPLVDMLTETDVLGIYGRQSLDFANMWNVPKPTDPLAYSFRIYRNFDGAGGQFGDTSVNSTSTDQGQLSVYGALRTGDGALTVVAINKTTTPIQTSLSLANFNSTSSALVYTYSNANLAQIVAGGPVSVASNSVTYNFPAYSATVFVFMPASATLAATITTLAASNTQLTTGQSVTLTARVAPKSGSGIPTGTAAFFDGAMQIGTSNLSSGSATLTTASLANGTHSLAVQYSGDANFAASTSAPLSITVSAPAKIATTTSASPSATQLTSGQMFTLNIMVAPKTESGVPTGTVTVLDGQTQLAMPALVAGAASYSTSNLAAGSHSITVTYSGDSNFATSRSAAISLTVFASAKINTSTSLSASAKQITSGGNLTFTARVAPQSGSGTPTGTVSFLDAQSQIGSAALAAGSVQFSTMSLAAGTHTITATYSGDANNNASTSAATSVTVTAAPTPDYSLSMSSSALTVVAGATGNLTLTVTPENGFKSPVTLTCSGLPTGASCAFSPATVTTTTGPVSTALTIQAPMANATDSNELGDVLRIGSGFARPGPSIQIFALWIFTLGFAATFGIFGSAARTSLATNTRLTQHFVAFVIVAAILGTVSCAGTTPQKQPPPSQNKVYTITVTASAANTPVHTESLTLTITP